MRSQTRSRTPTTRKFVPLHDRLLGSVSVQQVVNQLQPHMADTPNPQLPANLLQSLSAGEALLAKLVLDSASDLQRLSQQATAPSTVLRPELPIGPPPPPKLTPCQEVQGAAEGSADQAAADAVSAQNAVNPANAALQAAETALNTDDCSTLWQQIQTGLNAIALLDSAVQDAVSRAAGFPAFVSQANQLGCAATVHTSIADATTKAQSAANQATQIANGAATAGLAAALQHLQSVALAQCGPPQPPPPVPPMQCVKPVVMWYGLSFEMDEPCTLNFEKFLNGLSSGILTSVGIGQWIQKSLIQALGGSLQSVAGGVLTLIVEADEGLLAQAMRNVDQGQGATLHVSVIPIVGQVIVSGGISLVTALEDLIAVGVTAAIGQGANIFTPWYTVFWVTGN